MLEKMMGQLDIYSDKFHTPSLGERMEEGEPYPEFQTHLLTLITSISKT